jgi:hypothetical protein
MRDLYRLAADGDNARFFQDALCGAKLDEMG